MVPVQNWLEPPLLLWGHEIFTSVWNFLNFSGKLFFWTFFLFSWVFWVYFSFQTISSKKKFFKKFSSRIHLVYLWIRCRSVLLRTSWEVLTHREREPPVPERAVMLALFTDSQLGTESQKGATRNKHELPVTLGVAKIFYTRTIKQWIFFSWSKCLKDFQKYNSNWPVLKGKTRFLRLCSQVELIVSMILV